MLRNGATAYVHRRLHVLTSLANPHLRAPVYLYNVVPTIVDYPRRPRKPSKYAGLLRLRMFVPLRAYIVTKSDERQGLHSDF